MGWETQQSTTTQLITLWITLELHLNQTVIYVSHVCDLHNMSSVKEINLKKGINRLQKNKKNYTVMLTILLMECNGPKNVESCEMN